MIKSNGSFVAEVRKHLKALNKDDYISSRFILSVAKTYVDYLINSRPLSTTMREVDMFTYVRCLPMKRIKAVSCPVAEFRTCDKIMVSKCKLPDIYSGKGGFIVESITNIDDSVKYEILRSPSDFAFSKKRQFGSQIKYCYIVNSYLYILNSLSEIVHINAMFENEVEALKLSECTTEKNDFECLSYLDGKFVCPKEFVSTVRDQVINLLLSGYKQITEDEKPDLDSNKKTGV